MTGRDLVIGLVVAGAVVFLARRVRGGAESGGGAATGGVGGLVAGARELYDEVTAPRRTEQAVRDGLEAIEDAFGLGTTERLVADEPPSAAPSARARIMRQVTLVGD